MTLAELEAKTKEELIDMAKGLGLPGPQALRKQDLAYRVLQAQTEHQGNIFVAGVLESMNEGYGFLRQQTLLPSNADVYVSQSQIRRFGLRSGDMVSGQVRSPKEGEKYFGLLRVEAVNGVDPETVKRRPTFGSLTPVFPDRLLDLEHNPRHLATRLINLISPIGRGQRGLIVSSPKAGKTMLLKQLAGAISSKYDDINLMVLLIGERPEEVTDMRRSVKGEVVAATFDEPPEVHTRVAELALERVKRLVEMGRDVVVLLDGITRLTRAYNLSMPPTGRTLSGGIDSVALYPPKRFFGAARNTDEGGSLTILATCLVDTGSRMDELIYEEFKGTGNLEIHLDRRLAEKRVYPAMELLRSGTRREELLMNEQTLKQVWLFRRMVSVLGSSSNNQAEVTELVLERMSRTQSNAEFLANLSKDL
ncbi:MAG: transcription termination factor Rho [Dehalococcoidia bacterium]|jgi:transcription termination factor Rho|nr:transcription termination factor Rho [Dehalococcoidia bacterium]MDP7470049.1 transcription termination factor Rho [Dehalococcoidia bacterium]